MTKITSCECSLLHHWLAPRSQPITSLSRASTKRNIFTFRLKKKHLQASCESIKRVFTNNSGRRPKGAYRTQNPAFIALLQSVASHEYKLSSMCRKAAHILQNPGIQLILRKITLYELQPQESSVMRAYLMWRYTLI